ncbi:MAG: helix-turn-helix transcriptional regulator [Planctomycetia bacterium]|nr:helix-turn-helix transcriptional regulator [Planctomycetia bacterium]
MKLAKALALRIKQLREAAGLSQQEVAVGADLSMSLVGKLEQGKKADPRASTLLALARALGVPPGRLLEDLFPPTAPEPEERPETAEAGHAETADSEATAAESKPGKKKKKHKKEKGKEKAKAR